MLFRIFVILIIPSALLASFEEFQTDARLYGMAGAGVAVSDMPGSDLYNPALPAFAADLLVSSGSSMPFGLADLTAFSGSYAYQKSKIGAGLALATLGSYLYRENYLKGVFSVKPVEKASLGISINCYQLAIERYGSAVGVGLDLGLLGKPVEWLTLGLKAANVNRPTIGQTGEELDQSLSFGIAAQPLDRLIFSFQLHAQRDWPCQVRIGQEYIYRNLLAIRMGFNDRPNMTSLGFGVMHKKFRFDYAARTHADLGLSHCISVNYITQRIFARSEDVKIISQPPPTIIVKIDPNSASLEDLCLLPGIGPATAADIMAYRDSAGQFNYLEDLTKVKGIGPSLLEKMAPFVDLKRKPNLPGLIDINRATIEELSGLPNIGTKTANEIAAYRQLTGPFHNLEDIMNVKGIGRKTYEEIKTLITIGPE